MLEMSGYGKANLRVLMLSIFFAYFFLRTKFKALLYMSLMFLAFFIAFLFFRDVFLTYSGVVGIVMTLVAFAFGKKDWEFIGANKITTRDILFSTVYDKLFCIMFLILFMAIGLIKV